MARVARKLGLESWRDAVARRGGEAGCAEACLEAFEAYRIAGDSEFIASLSRDGEIRLSRSGFASPATRKQPLDEAENDQIEPPGS